MDRPLYKIGDKATITGNISGHMYSIGDTVIISEIGEYFYYVNGGEQGSAIVEEDLI